MAIRLFRCSNCDQDSQMDAFTAAEARDPLFYTCVRCGHRFAELPDEVIDEHESPKKRRRRIFS